MAYGDEMSDAIDGGRVGSTQYTVDGNNSRTVRACRAAKTLKSTRKEQFS